MSLKRKKFAEMQLEIQKDLEKLKLEEDSLVQEMNLMLNERKFLEDKVQKISTMLPTLKSIKIEAVDLVNTIKDVSESSEKISGKIRSLDAARSRVEECQNRVGDLIDLEICSQGVQTAILDQDYEKGAGHVHRFLSMDQTLLKKTATNVENVSNTLKSVRTLQDATSQLRAIVEHKFNEAVKVEDLGAIERFFKIFPLLGMHDEGIREFCTYLRTKVSDVAEKNLKSAISTPYSDKRHSVIFADTLTLLFEGLAKIIDSHQPLIETYYGPGKLILAITVLQKECDLQIKRILQDWATNRHVHKKIQQISEYQRLSAGGSFHKLEKIDPKDLDPLIGEIILMHFRIELYIKFLQRKVTHDLETKNDETKNVVLKKLDQIITDSELSQVKHEILSHYIRFEQYFMEETVAKAVAMDSIDSGQNCSTMVDDAFFIVKKCIRRSISSGNLDGICAIINTACRVLENDYCDILKVKLKQGYPSGYLDLTQAYNVLQSSIQQGRLQSGADTEHARTTFIVALNNVDVSTEYVDALCDTTLKEIESALPVMLTNERGKLESCLSGLSSVTINLKDLIDYGIQQLRSSVIKPRVNPWVDTFSSINHQLTEDELSAYEAGESFVQTLIMNLDSLISDFKGILTEKNFDVFVVALTSEITQRFEKVILKSTYNRLGGLILDKEVRSLSGYITATTSYSVRDKFARLSQIATVLNLENPSEISDYWGNHDGALTWRLTPAELKTIMSLRVDFKFEDMRRLKL